MARSKREKFEYEYGSEGRVRWIKNLPCCACGTDQGCDNAHIRGMSGGGGVGRKAHHRWCCPLCYNCHRVRIPDRGQKTLEATSRLRLFGLTFDTFDDVAEAVDVAYIHHLARGIA